MKRAVFFVGTQRLTLPKLQDRKISRNAVMEEESDMTTDYLRQQRIDLAAAFRWAARLGFHEGVCNHFSVAVSPGGDRFLVNPHGRHFSEIRASDLLLVEPDGSVAGD